MVEVTLIIVVAEVAVIGLAQLELDVIIQNIDVLLVNGWVVNEAPVPT